MAEVVNVTDGAFDRAILQADRPVVAAFFSRQDERADDLRQVLEATAAHHAEAIRVARLERDDVPRARVRFEVDTLPQVLFFRDGRLVARARGMPTEEALRPWVEFLLGRGPAPSARRPKAQPGTAPGHPLTVTDADFDRLVLGAQVPVLVDFWAGWCAPCQMLAPVIDRLAAEFAGRAVVAKLDVEANPRTAQRYQAMSIPLLVLFQDGQEVDRLVGVRPEGEIRSRLAVLLSHQ